jgi:uncharacterized protein
MSVMQGQILSGQDGQFVSVRKPISLPIVLCNEESSRESTRQHIRNLPYSVMPRLIPVLLTFALLTFAGFLMFAEDGQSVDFKKGGNAFQNEDNETTMRRWTIFDEQITVCGQFEFGNRNDKRQGAPHDDENALKWLQCAAESGNARSHYRLGDRYARGEGVLQNHAIAAKWYQLARKQGDEVADLLHDLFERESFNLAFEFLRKEDYAFAFSEWEILARHSFDSAPAQYQLGEMYKYGRGIKQDFVAAFMWYDIAAYRGIDEAENSRDSIAKQMTPSQVESAKILAKVCLSKNFKSC